MPSCIRSTKIHTHEDDRVRLRIPEPNLYDQSTIGDLKIIVNQWFLYVNCTSWDINAQCSRSISTDQSLKVVLDSIAINAKNSTDNVDRDDINISQPA